MIRIIFRLAFCYSLFSSAAFLFPYITDAVHIWGGRFDPATALKFHLLNVEKADYQQAARDALKDNDPELARSLVELAVDHKMAIEPDLLAQIADAEKFSLARSGVEVWKGAVLGEVNSPQAFAASMVADMTAVGDLRDIVQEAVKYPNQDNLAFVLSAAGLGATASTVTSLGASAPVKIGLSFMKTAKRMRKLSKPLEAHMISLARDAIDPQAVKALAQTLKSLDRKGLMAQAKRLVKPRVLHEIKDIGQSMAGIVKKQGYRGSVQTLEMAKSPQDLKRFHRLSDTLGNRTYRGALKILKSSAKLTLLLGEFLWHFIDLLFAVFGWFVAFCVLMYRLVRWSLGRPRRISDHSQAMA